MIGIRSLVRPIGHDRAADLAPLIWGAGGAEALGLDLCGWIWWDA